VLIDISKPDFLNMSNSRKYIAAIALTSTYLAGLQLFTTSISNAATPIAQNNNTCSFINENNVNIRSGPKAKAGAVAKLNRGDVVRAVRKSGSWVQISGRVTSKPGVTPEVVKPLNGWVSNKFINGCSEDQFERWRS